MQKIEVKVLEANLDGTPRFLAKLTQRGQSISCMNDVDRLYLDNTSKDPSTYLMSLPHSTLRRMNYITIAITGLSTKAVSQLRTHAKRLTFISTSTQYSAYDNRKDNFVIPDNIDGENREKLEKALDDVYAVYVDLIRNGVDNDTASYVLPQSLRKALIISGNLDDWQYVIRTRLCNRNSTETRTIARMIYDEIKKIGDVYVTGMLPSCVHGTCEEGRLSCGKPFKL